jgi:ribosomal protein L37E
MADIVRDAHQEFWRPPLNQSVASEMAESCRRCGTEFMVGAAFCHICGAGRHRAATASATNWLKAFDFMRPIELGRVKGWFGLPLPSLFAFLSGAACLIVAVAVGFTDVKDNVSDFEAVQLWRIQWLMAACAAFLVGILFKGSKSES